MQAGESVCLRQRRIVAKLSVSVIISSTDEELYRKLGINVCCEPKYERLSLYHK